jgi:hypothetical protein
MAKDAGRDPASLSFNVFGAPRDLEVLKRYRDAGVDRVVLMLPPKPRDEILPMLDESATPPSKRSYETLRQPRPQRRSIASE